MDRDNFQVVPSPIQSEMPPIASCPGSRRARRCVQGRGKAGDGKISGWDCSQHSQTPPQKCTERTHPIDPASLDLGGTNKKPHHQNPQTAFAASVLPKMGPGFRITGSLGLEKPSTIIESNLCPNTPLSLNHRASPSLLLLPPCLSQAHAAPSPSTTSLEPAPASPAAESSLVVPGEGGPGVLSSRQRVFSTPTHLSRQVGDPSRSPAT